jgi:hypothetical protein
LPVAFVIPVTNPLTSAMDVMLPNSAKKTACKPPIFSRQSIEYPLVIAHGIIKKFKKKAAFIAPPFFGYLFN